MLSPDGHFLAVGAQNGSTKPASKPSITITACLVFTRLRARRCAGRSGMLCHCLAIGKRSLEQSLPAQPANVIGPFRFRQLSNRSCRLPVGHPARPHSGRSTIRSNPVHSVLPCWHYQSLCRYPPRSNSLRCSHQHHNSGSPRLWTFPCFANSCRLNRHSVRVRPRHRRRMILY